MAVVIVFGVGWLWFRSSSLVAIEHVEITGVNGPDVTQITRALTSTAETMTTLDLDVSALERSVQPYPYVHSLSVSTHFPHGLTIAVLEQVPVATVSIGARTLPVNGAGELLPAATTPHGPLPTLSLTGAAGGAAVASTASAGGTTRIAAASSLAGLSVLAAAPYGFLLHVASVSSNAVHGVVVQMRRGPQIYFGGSARLVDKWTAALAVLAAAGSAGAQYIDVSDPERPAVGAPVPTAQQASVAPAQTSSG